MIGMDGDVKSHELMEFRVVEAQHVRVVCTIVQCSISSSDVFVVAVFVCEDKGCNSRALSGEVEAIFKSRFPVFGFVDTAVVGLHEVRLGLAHQDTCGELSHGMHIFRECLDESFLFVSEGTTVEEVFLERSHLRVAGKFSSEEEPESTFGVGLTSGNGLVSVLSDVE